MRKENSSFFLPSSSRGLGSISLQSSRKLYNVMLLTEAAIMGKGMHFGELALIKAGKKRTATVVTLEDCDFAVMDKKSYTRAMGRAM